MCGRRRGSKEFCLKIFQARRVDSFLAGSQVVKVFPKVFGWLETIAHFTRRRDGGGVPLRTVSMSAKRPAFASPIPRLNDSGIQESSDSMTNLATSARWLGGNALNCLITACALMPRINHHRTNLASGEGLQIQRSSDFSPKDANS